MPARILPSRPNLGQYRKQAKELVKAVGSADADALARARSHHPRFHAITADDARPTAFTLADAQFVIAREHGLESWPKFVEEIEKRSGPDSLARVWTLAERATVAGDVATLERLVRDHAPLLKPGAHPSWFNGLTSHFSGDVRGLIAAHHQFATWQEFDAFTQEVRDEASLTHQFEAAVDAVVSGDEATLDRLLRAHPELIHVRSKRPHHSTLLLYVGANGVEGFRQKTPKNAVRIAEQLLAAGAEVDAVGAMYRGTTTLGLVATSVFPVQAGVQAALIDVLLEAGASLARAVAPDYTYGRVVNACLANGRGEGAALVAARGAELDLEGAAGVGRLDVVSRAFDEHGQLKAEASRAQLLRGGFWACQYGHLEVVDFLLQHGIDPAGATGNETMLHGAALGGQPEIVRLLIAHRVPIDVKDDHFHATPLSWALHGWRHRSEHTPPEPYFDVVRQLVAAGARVEDAWLADEYVSADLQMLAALTRHTPS